MVGKLSAKILSQNEPFFFFILTLIIFYVKLIQVYVPTDFQAIRMNTNECGYKQWAREIYKL